MMLTKIGMLATSGTLAKPETSATAGARDLGTWDSGVPPTTAPATVMMPSRAGTLAKEGKLAKTARG